VWNLGKHIVEISLMILVRPAMTSAASYERMVGTYRLDAQILQILYTLANI